MRVAVHDFGHNYRVPSLQQQPASLPGQRRLIIVSGEEGAGKSTLVRALLPSTPNGARLDAEDIGQTNPCPMDDEFFGLLRPERGRPR